MLKLKFIYIASLILVGVLLVATIYLIPQRAKLTEVQRNLLLQSADRYVMQLDLFNKEGKDTSYTVDVSIDGKLYTQKVAIEDGKGFTYLQPVYPRMVTEGIVTLTVYREDEPVPIEQTTYFVDF